MQKFLEFIQEIGSILYVGGILSHIVIGNVIGHPDAQTAYNVYVYKEMSAYILILPGMTLKIISDIAMFARFKIVPNWLKVKMLMMLFLGINAFVFLVPMMPEIVQLAKESMNSGKISQAFIDKTTTEGFIGMSNAIPLLIEIFIGSFKPKLFKERTKI